jgi:hypothetical protein
MEARLRWNHRRNSIYGISRNLPILPIDAYNALVVLSQLPGRYACIALVSLSTGCGCPLHS